jgi:hypothetical protein
MPVHTYRKRPVTIEALQWTGDNVEAIQQWVGCQEGIYLFLPECGHDMSGTDNTKPVLYVAANDAWLNVEIGEWIAKDRHGFYPIKDDVFLESYDKAELIPDLVAELKVARAEVEQLRADIPALLAAANAPEAER